MKKRSISKISSNKFLPIPAWRTLPNWQRGVFAVLLFFSSPLKASPWNLGIGMGLGGQGIVKQVDVESALTTVQRGESPLMTHVFLDHTLSSSWGFSIEHSRGVRLGPFSSGVGFTSAIWRWYYLAPPIELVSNEKGTYLFEKRWTAYTGIATGLAYGTITREADQVPSVTESGVHIGFRNGVDYLLNPKMGLRSEIAFSTTIAQSQARPGAVREFSLWTGIYFPYF